jgi:hypothetical protein
LISAFDESHMKVVVRFVASEGPVLQTTAATGNVFGPELTLLLSRPITFQLLLAIVRAANAGCGSNTKMMADTTPATAC